MAKKNKIENRNKATAKQIFNDTLVYILLITLSIIWLFPIVWIIINSFRANSVAGDPYIGSYFPTLWPEHWTLENYSELFKAGERQIIDFPRMFLNTLFISIFSCVVSTIFVISVSYVLSRRRFKSRQSLIKGSMILGLFPGFMAIVAIYQILKALNLIGGNNTYVALILLYSAGAGMGFLLLKGYIDAIPIDLDEAATIDGATQWEIFTKIIIPIAKPMIVYQILTAFLGPWLDFISAKVIAGADPRYWTVSVGLYNMLSRNYVSTWFTNFMAGSVLVSIPIATLTIIMQRFYNQSLSGAVKG